MLCVFVDCRYTRTYLLVVGVSLLVRPTGMLLWAPLVLAHLAMGSIKNRMHCLVVMQEMFMIGYVMPNENNDLTVPPSLPPLSLLVKLYTLNFIFSRTRRTPFH